MRFDKYFRYAAFLAISGLITTTNADAEKEIYPIHISYPNTPTPRFITTGHWTNTPKSVANSGQGEELLKTDAYSALKNITIETTFEFKDINPQGAAGIRIGFSISESICWTYMYFPSEKKLKIEYRNKGTVKLLKSFDRTLTPPYILRIEHKSNGQTSLTANGEKLSEGKNAFGGIPVFNGSGVIAINAAIEVKKLDLYGGDYIRPAIAVGDSITHHCQWQRFASQLTGVPFTNAGMAGEDSKMTRKRFATDILPLQPKLIFIFIGTNDNNSASALDNVKAMTDTAAKAGIPVVICTLIPRAALPKIDEFNRGIKLLATEKKLPLVDWNQVLDDGNKRIQKVYGDEVHPNSTGAMRMAEFLCAQKEIRKMLDALKPSQTTSEH